MKNLSHECTGGNDPLKMIATVERAHMDLERLKEEAEMYNGVTISIIEEAMTANMRYEWVKEIASKCYCSKEKFEALLKFLGEWRTRLEYGGESIQGATEFLGQSHHANERQRPNMSSKFNKRSRCWLHNLDGEPGEHPIWKCRLFMSKPVQERIQLVVINKACQRCLEVFCPGSSNPKECERKFRCFERGCGAEHNSLLHSNTIPGKVNHTDTNQGAGMPAGTTLLPLQVLEA